MQINPYSPPNANVQAESREVVRRPLSVWLLEILLIVCVLLFLFGLTRSVLAGEAGELAKQNPVAFAIGTAWRSALLLVLVAMIYCVHRRVRFSRWIGPTVIAAIAAISLIGPDKTQYASEAERAGGALGRTFLVPALLAWWAYAVCFSEKAKQYFAVGQSEG